MIEVREHPAIIPAIARGEFRALVDRDMPRALELAREGLGRDPLAAVFDEAWLNALGYELMQRGQPEKSVQILTLNVEAHPASANTYDSLSEVLEATGNPSAAAQWTAKGLATIPNDRSIPETQRKALEETLRTRAARLKGN